VGDREPDVAAGLSPLRVRGLHHAGVHVASLERSIAFYETVFGLQVAARLRLGDEQLAFLHAGTGWLELIADGAGPRPAAGAVDHLALVTSDLDGWLARLQAQGVPLLDAAPLAVPALGVRILFCLGPDGERIELLEPTGPGPLSELQPSDPGPVSG
jgi:lactoylglutathione lyase